MLQPNYEPYSAVAFQHKQQTSPYPYHDEPPRSHTLAFLKSLDPQTSSLRLRRRLRYQSRKIIGIALILLPLIYYANVIRIYWSFARIKLDNVLFDEGWITCGVMRKEPVLYVQDTKYVQIVWEMNCGTTSKDMFVTLESPTKKVEEFGPIDMIKLDERHTVYKATLGPLEAGGQYAYRIDLASKSNPSWWNKRRSRRTLASYDFQWRSTSDSAIRIAAMADNQFGMKTFTTVLGRVSKHKPIDYLLHAGDAVQHYGSLREWQTDFVGPLTYHGIGQRMPIIYAHGNHDYDRMAEYYYTRTLPSKDPWFAFSLADGAIRFCVLDSNLDWVSQEEWLRQELASDASQKAQLRIVIVHVPPFLEFWDPYAWFHLRESEWGAFIKDKFVPLFNQYGVDLVISGHQHNYERGERDGVHYAIIGGAGGDLDNQRVVDWGMYESSKLDFHYVIIDLEPIGERWRLNWNAYDLNGETVDTMVIDPKPSRWHESTGAALDRNSTMEEEGGNTA
ncbi:hypothetical protein DFQ28_000346 [Apophysomyces sp. BC1034]|nr:hypothetical protein DFQ30_000661 [Apophysomyces sp. BC1015]KAG0180555.1 hypothetical protein DFQ29_000408 [Apophysomyces sp. BC1021]KAG0183986.1 hypothetical protein DFQ28_000346 [Apophysomyces sp. BC1034]